MLVGQRLGTSRVHLELQHQLWDAGQFCLHASSFLFISKMGVIPVFFLS